MSYDLYFCSQRDEALDFNAVVAWAGDVGNFEHKGTQLWYENKETGVYFSLDFEQGKFDSPEDNILPAGFFDSGLSFNLNYNRPSFFAYEAMPLVEEISARFNLCIYDPQGGDEAQCKIDRENLIRSWITHNENAVKVMVEQGVQQDSFMARANSEYLWNYLRQKSDLQTACGDQIFVPSLVPVKVKSEGHVGIAFVVGEGVLTLIPQSTWIFIVLEKRAFQKKKEVFAIDAATFSQVLRPYLDQFEWNGLNLRVIRSGSVHLVGKLLRDLSDALPRDNFEVLAMDSFVDIAS